VDLPEPCPGCGRAICCWTTGYSWPKEALEERRWCASWRRGRERDRAGRSALRRSVFRCGVRRGGSFRLAAVRVSVAVPFAGNHGGTARKIMAETASRDRTCPRRSIVRSRAAAGDGFSLDALTEWLARWWEIGNVRGSGRKICSRTRPPTTTTTRCAARRSRGRRVPVRSHAEFERRGVAQQIRTAQRHVRVPAIEGLGWERAWRVDPARQGSSSASFVILEGKTPLNRIRQAAPPEHAALVAAIRIAHERELESLESRLGYASFLSFLESDSSARWPRSACDCSDSIRTRRTCGNRRAGSAHSLGREELGRTDARRRVGLVSRSASGAPSLVTALRARRWAQSALIPARFRLPIIGVCAPNWRAKSPRLAR